METKNKVRVYIDGANMLYTQKKLGWNIDWRKLADYLKSKWDVAEIKYYTGVKEDDEKMRGFLNCPRRISWKMLKQYLELTGGK